MGAVVTRQKNSQKEFQVFLACHVYLQYNEDQLRNIFQAVPKYSIAT